MKEFNRASVSWTVKEMIAMVSKGKIVFNNAVQRGLVWDDARKSLLIDSILQGYEVPPMYAKKGDGNVYDMLDVKQRCNAVIDFVGDKFPLTEVSEDLEDYDGLLFSQLEPEDQDTILSYSLKVTYFDGASDEDVQEIFYRLNNGKPLSSYEQTRVKAKSLPEVQKLCLMPLFDTEKTGRKYTGYKREELVYKLLMVLTEDNPDLERKSLAEYIRSHEITEDEVKLATTCFNMYTTIIDNIMETATDDDRKLKTKIYKRLVSQTHMISAMPFMVRAAEEKRSLKQMQFWLESFYAGKKRATVSETYNDNASRGSAKRASVDARHKALEKSYEKFMADYVEEPMLPGCEKGE